MKKKLFTFALAVALLLPLAIAFTGCSNSCDCNGGAAVGANHAVVGVWTAEYPGSSFLVDTINIVFGEGGNTGMFSKVRFGADGWWGKDTSAWTAESSRILVRGVGVFELYGNSLQFHCNQGSGWGVLTFTRVA